MYNEGDFVKVKPNTKLESGEIVNNWAGEVVEVYNSEKCALVHLDALTINLLEDSYIKTCMLEGCLPFEYVFAYEDLEKSTRRSTKKELKKALDNLASRMLDLEVNEEDGYWEQAEQWISEFKQSANYQELGDVEQENADFVLETFMDYMYNYAYQLPGEWTSSAIKEICLDVVPSKVSAEIECFESYGPVLFQFLTFLGDKGYILNARTLCDAVRKIKNRIPEKAQDPNNWGMAKTMMMLAYAQGVDVSDEEEMEKFFRLQQLNFLNQEKVETNTARIEDPFKKLGRNQKITVKYDDGQVLENVKFKKVESDLRSGLCVLIST